MLILLKPTLGSESAALLAILGRCWQTALEIIVAVVVLVVVRQARGSHDVPEATERERKADSCRADA